MGLPIDCAPGETCHIQQYVDRDPGPEARDWACGPLSYEGHKGTDFSLATLARMAEGVDVLASAPGVVRGVRDGMPDVAQGEPGAPDLEGRDCGNGVAVVHEHGWETQYCHMRRGSIAVSPGDRVERGDRLGLVGLSGNTQFPHAHLSVRHEGAVVDPFAPGERSGCGEASEDSLWQDAPAYEPGGLLTAGFATKVPGYEAVKAGKAGVNSLSETAAALVLWAYFFGGRSGDEVNLRFSGPGMDFEHRETLDRTQARLFRAAGKRAPADGLAPGLYIGTVTLTRDGETVDTLTTEVRVD